MALKIFWAFDPFDENKSVREKGLELLKRIGKPSDEVVAVHMFMPPEIVSPLVPGVPVFYGGAFDSKNIRAQVKEKMGRLKSRGIHVEVLESSTYSLTKSVRAFAKYVENKRGDLILVATHGRTGMPRMVLGSFAESLIHFAKTDIIVFQPQTKTPLKSPARLLYAHDFSRWGEIGFQRAIEYAKRWGAALDVIHIPQPMYAVRFAGQDPQVEVYRKRVKAKMRRTEKQIEAAGIAGTASFETQWAPLVDMILKSARKRKADMVCVTAQSSRFAALLGGSVTRALVRQPRLPILILKV